MRTSGGDSRITSADRSSIATYIRADIVGIGAGIAVLIVANGLIVQEPLAWILAPALVTAIVIDLLALRQVEASLLASLGFITLGKWMIALFVTVVLPFVWPVMLLTVIVPLVLATPYLTDRLLLLALTGGAAMAAAVGAIGVLFPDGGVIDHIDMPLELTIVVFAVAAQTVVIGRVVWQNNRLQRQALEQLRRSQDDLVASRRRVVEAADAARSRIERDLHDGAQQRLVALGMRLRLLESQRDDASDPPGPLGGLVGELEAAVEELRELAHGIYPPLLTSRGLGEALVAVALRSTTPIRVDVEGAEPAEPPVEAALYFTALEALANAAKHAGGAEVSLSLRATDGELELRVIDDGPGFDRHKTAGGRGTLNMADRIGAVGGQLRIESEPGCGTSVTASVPLG